MWTIDANAPLGVLAPRDEAGLATGEDLRLLTAQARLIAAGNYWACVGDLRAGAPLRLGTIQGLPAGWDA